MMTSRYLQESKCIGYSFEADFPHSFHIHTYAATTHNSPQVFLSKELGCDENLICLKPFIQMQPSK